MIFDVASNIMPFIADVHQSTLVFVIDILSRQPGQLPGNDLVFTLDTRLSVFDIKNS